MKRRVAILGATGSIGRSTAAVVQELNARGAEIEVEALAAGRDVAGLAALAQELRPRFVAIGEPGRREELAEALAAAGVEAAIGAGPAAVEEAASRDADWVMSAIVGAAALGPTLAAARRGATVALANKECLVCGGSLVMRTAQAAGGAVIPVDSEHNAVFQVLGRRQEDVAGVTLTASGGPFRTASLAEMAAATPEQACRHPTWSMGAKISVDSATMMNKGLELIEASVLFELEAARLDVLVHPQSIIHSLVTFVDGSTLAQLSEPDMRVPIVYSLAWPERAAISTKRLDLARHGALTFEAPDPVRFPALRLAREALEAAGAGPLVLNAANETAVAAFLERRIGFLDIGRVVEDTLDAAAGTGGFRQQPTCYEDVAEMDAWARAASERAIVARAALAAGKGG